MNERKLIESILTGDTAKFSCLLDKYQHMAFCIAYRILENKEDAEEAVQDAFVKMYHALPAFRFGSKFSTWFYKIVYHTALTHCKLQFVFVGYEDIPEAAIATNDLTEGTETILERSDRKEIIDSVLKRLRKDDALLLSLFYLQECSVDDIHQITGLSKTNIKTKLFRGRNHFYEILQQMMKHETTDII